MPIAREVGPLHVPSLTVAEQEAVMTDLRIWVDRLADRFALDTRTLPPCWEQHNGLVEVLSALRDHERASYAGDADPRSAFDWQRAVRDARYLLTDLAAITGCSPGQHRDAPPRTLQPSSGAAWSAG